MILNAKKGILYASVFGLYQIVINLFFGVESFLASESGSTLFMVYTFGTIVLSEFLLLTATNSLKTGNSTKRIYFSVSFMIASIISGTIIWWILSTTHRLYFVFISAFLVASLLPVFLSILYFIFLEAKTRINISVSSKEDEFNSGGVVSKQFILENENGKQILNIATTDLICFEANDNYVITYYLNKEGQLKKTMDRYSLKKIDDLLRSKGINYLRVHKSYIVNPEFITSIKGKAQAYKLELKHLDIEIPVSRSYDISLLKA
jgi:hypothetical protein